MTAHLRLRYASVLLAVAASLACAPELMAATQWQGTDDANWLTATNWSPAAVPDSSVDVIINNDTTAALSSGSQETGLLTVGDTANGGLSLSGTATVTATHEAHFGVSNGSTGTLAIDGNAASFVAQFGGGQANDGNLYIGDSGTGIVNITNGGTLSIDSFLYAGQNADGVATINVDGTGSSLDIQVFSFLGIDGKATLNVTNGALASMGFAPAELGQNAGGEGTINVSGTGSLLSFGGNLAVGDSGTGTINVSNGGSVDLQYTCIGCNSGSNGSITVTGSGSTLTENSNLYIGFSGEGALTVSDGASANIRYMSIADQTGGEGSLTVTGAGSSLTILINGFEVGYRGTGNVIVSDGATLTTPIAILGDQNGSSGSVLVTGAGTVLNDSWNFFIGSEGQGSLTVEKGAVVNISTQCDVGSYSVTTTSPLDSLVVTGAGSKLLMGDMLLAGGYSNVSVLFADGATVSDTMSILSTDSANVTTTVLVTGAGTTWTNSDHLVIGEDSTVSLTIADGATVSNNMGLISSGTTENSTVLVTGAGTTWTNNDFIEVDGDLTVANGAHVSTSSFLFVEGSHRPAHLTITGAGTLVTSADHLIIGESSGNNGVLTLSDNALLQAQTDVLIGAGTGITGTLNIGAAAGEAAVAPGTLETPSIVMGPGTAAIVFNHTSADYTFAAPISGTGTLSFLSGKTILTGDSSAFTGTTALSGGILSVNGSLGGTLSVLSGGRLQGSGTVDDTTVVSGGTIAPGNSIGTLHVAGNLTMDAGSTYEVEANPAGASDQIIATGTITINGGTLALLPAAGFYTPGTTYTVLSAASGLSGRFDQVTSSLSWLFMEPVVSYEATSANIRLDRNATPFAAVADTANEQAVAHALDGLSATSAVYDAFVNQTDIATARGALLDLSGDLHPSIKATLGQNQDLIEDAILNRLDETTPQPKVQTKQAAKLVTPKVSYFRSDLYDHLNRWKKKPVVQPTPTRFDPKVWAEGFGDWGHRSSNGNALSFRNNSGGGIVGADAALDKAWRAGFAIAYGSGQYDQANHAKGSSNSAYLSLFAAREKDNLALRFGVTGGWHDITTRRSISFPGLAESLHADYNAQTAAGFVEGAYNIRLQQTTLSPFIRGGVSFINVPSFAEEGGAAALRGDTSSSLTGQTLVGLKARQAFLNNRGRLQAELGWKHLMGDITPNQRFRIDGSAPFTIDGAPLAADTLLTGFGVSWALTREGSLGLTYRGQWAASQADQSVRGFVRYAF